ncbi:MAG: NAD(P)H-dependent oxidoreductase [Gammaproteobacteria bacterium]|nr:NAD(P)H-dependent oxidoreductase [Gammaproteobacteria bacterium]
MSRILAFAGSTRTDSFNRKLVKAAVTAAESTGVGCTLIELADYSLPIYDGDLEAADGVPANALELRRLFKEHQGFLIAAPEYNSSVTPLLKNTIDWVSRPVDGEPGGLPYQGKVAALLSASPGALGGLRGLAALRPILTTLGTVVIPQQFALGRAGNAFDDDGQLPAGAERDRVESVVAALAEWVKRAAS